MVIAIDGLVRRKSKSYDLSEQRRVIGHSIISDVLPSIEIKVDPIFEYVGQLSFVLKEIAQVERFIFADRQSLKTTRLFIVQFEGILDGVDFTYKYQFTNPILLGKYAYHHSVWFYSNSESVREEPGAESDLTTQFLQSRGFAHEEELAMSRFARIVDDAHRYEIIIFYQETLGSMGLSLDVYSQRTQSEQKGIEDSLSERSLRNFHVVDLE